MEAEEPLRPSLWDGLSNLLTQPFTAFVIIQDRWQVKHQLIILGIYGMLKALTTIGYIDNEPIRAIGQLCLSAFLGTLVGWIGIWLMAQLTNTFNRMFHADSDSNEVLAIFAFSLAPVIITFLIVVLASVVFMILDVYAEDVEAVISLLPVLAWIWTLVLMCIGNNVITQLPGIKSTMAVLIPAIIIFILSILFSIGMDMVRS